MDRRCFLKSTGAALGAGALLATGREVEASGAAATAPTGKRLAMIVDTRKCLQDKGCTKCSDACHLAHNVPKIPDPRHEVKWIWKESYAHAFPTQVHEFTEESLREQPVPVTCNHCDNAPCVKVCPPQATFRRDDGLVVMDMHRCIGCRYCMAACPYGSRSFNWRDPRPFIPAGALTDRFPTRTKGVVEKCNFCAERLAEGKWPVCVEACRERGNGAMMFGDLAKMGSEVMETLRTHHSIRRKPGLGTAPHVFYLV